jgi:hypothetical protein
MAPEQARELLTYDRDREVLDRWLRGDPNGAVRGQ